MTLIHAESNRSRITSIIVLTESEWMRIQNLSNKIGCGVKKNRVRTPLLAGRDERTVKFFSPSPILI